MISRRRSTYLLLCSQLLLAVGCWHRGPLTGAPQRDRPVPKRLVLALDGIDYRDIMLARHAGMFAEFREPSRLISTFPSISDIAWHDIFGVLPPPGYQRIYFSTAYNDVVGTPLDAIRPIEFEERMDMAFGTKFHHLSAYIASNSVARNEISTVAKEFIRFAGRSTVYVYNVGPDALQHTRGDLPGYLRFLDGQLLALQRDYQKRTGTSLEIAILSDHGHNHIADARFLPVDRELKAHGFQAAVRLEHPDDVAFSVDGVTTGFGVFVELDSVPVVAGLLAQMDGVELVTSRVSEDRFLVETRVGHAYIERRRLNGSIQYRYQAAHGDPLEHASILARMFADSAVDSAGFADGATWLRYSTELRYPAALERIVRGHTVVTLNPAPILVSVANGHQVGLGMVSVANRLRPLGGTHGGLDSANSLGVVMTNFMTTHDDVTERVRAQFDGFADLSDIQHPPSGARLTSRALKDRNPRRPVYSDTSFRLIEEHAPLLEIWLTNEQRQWAAEGGGIFIEVQRVDANGDLVENIGVSHLPLPPSHGTNGGMPDASSDWMVADDGRHLVIPISSIVQSEWIASTSYVLRMALDRTPPRRPDLRSLTKEIATLTIRTDINGRIWPY